MENLRTLTIVKTDIRRFTDRVQEMSAPELDAFLREHRAFITSVFREHGGVIVKEIGDSYLVTFESCRTALLACIAVQRTLATTTTTSQDREVEVRIAVTAGDVLLQAGDVFGTPVNMVARVEALAPPGDIYFTEAVYQNLDGNEVASEFVGTFTLKGIREPQRIYKTTFRHQTRIICDAAVLFTYFLSAKFVESAKLELVEHVFDFWERAHREVAAGHEGVVRTVIGDTYVTTFDHATHAVAAWLDLVALVESFNSAGDCPFQMDVMAGMDVGDIRVFRSTSYGDTFNRASICSDFGRVNTLTLPASVIPSLPPGMRDLLDTRQAKARNEQAAQRANAKEVGELVSVLPRCDHSKKQIS